MTNQRKTPRVQAQVLEDEEAQDFECEYEYDAYVNRIRKRLKEKFDQDEVAYQQVFYDTCRKLQDGDFAELEKATGVTLGDEERGFLHSTVGCYGFMSRGFRNHGNDELRKQVEAVADKIEERLMDCLDRAIEIPFILRSYARTLSGFSRGPSKPGRRPRTEDAHLISGLAYVFDSAGGRVAISVDGPFTRFLQAIWEVLPEDLRPRSADALVAHAKFMLPILREQLKRGKTVTARE